MTDLIGILPVLPTPFLPEGGVDVAAMADLVEFSIESEVAGVVFPGFASEVEMLTPQEREALLEVVAQKANGKIHVIAGASAKTAAEVIGHGRVAAKLGINLLMIQAPKELGSEFEAVKDFFSEITAELPDAQIILQNAPAPRGSDLSPKTILELARSFSQICYVKEETLPAGPAISEIMAQRPESLKGVIGGGGARYILDEYERGACAAMPAIEIADLHVEMDKAWRSGNGKDARALYVKTLPLLVLQAVYRMRLTKLTMMERGILKNAGVRAPTPEVDAIAAADILLNLKELGIEKSTQVQGAVE